MPGMGERAEFSVWVGLVLFSLFWFLKEVESVELYWKPQSTMSHLEKILVASWKCKMCGPCDAYLLLINQF